MAYLRHPIQGARGADDLELGALELPLPGAPEPLSGYMRSTVTPRRCPPGMVPTSRGCIKPKTVGSWPKVSSPIARALGMGATDCGCGCKGAGTCGKSMGDDASSPSTALSVGVKVGLVGITGFLLWRSLKKG